MKLNKKKLGIIIIIIALFIIIVCLFIKRDKILLCEFKESNEINITNITIKVYDKLSKYSVNYLYQYNEGYMDNVVDKYDSVNAYLGIINKKDGINFTIKQEGYNLEYNINLELDKINKEDYKLLEIEEITKLDNIKDIKKYYEDLGYTCE